MRRPYLLLATLLLIPAPARAALDAESQTPYAYRVVLMVDDHPFFTPVFKEQVRREIRDGFQAALRGLADVDVVLAPEVLQKAESPEGRKNYWDRTRDLLVDVEANGLEKGLDDHAELAPVKTHFVRIQLDGSRYRIETRQLDGYTGLASPVVRGGLVLDRQLVARSALLFMNRDFGLVGTIDPREHSGEVEIRFKGGELGVPLTSFTQKDDVYVISEIQQGKDGLHGGRMSWALLQVLGDPRDGRCMCRFVHRYGNPFARAAGIAGYRCLKVGTSSATLRIRLVDETSHAAMPFLRVKISGYHFWPESQEEEGATDAEGLFSSKNTYERIAFVSVLRGDRLLAQIPIEMIGERPGDRPVVCPIRLDEGVERRVPVDLAIKRLMEKVDEALAKETERTKELDRANEAKAADTASAQAREGIHELDAENASFDHEVRHLRSMIHDKGLESEVDLRDLQQRLNEVRLRRDRLQKYVDELQAVIAQGNDPKYLRWREKIERAHLLEAEADFERAIKLYREVAEEGHNDPALQKNAEHLQKLEAEWKTKSEAHRQAAQFIAETWPKLTTAAELKEHLGEARKALAVFRENHDHLRPLVLVKENTAHAARLKKQLESLPQAGGDAEREQIKQITGIVEELRSLTTEAAQAVNEGRGARGAGREPGEGSGSKDDGNGGGK